ncbi:Proteinase inhibitor I33, aspin domain-containing protein [Strongyloides ratti]|uniref:Proteinase inhibitor I33, aspin domain-containing protein n=1 Tax=Strongyloides ratti TaxID=34506 RepID=A0A090LMW0_STRRB|nr:Proteinase inhibitor I33, aspin domain-containing protein [Strongyloides ratti]CEF71170.1 Proteinase inhibitor I33, aspin domain-containing protein [Strongyloides ratti]
MKFYITVFLCFLGVSILMAKPAKRFAGFGVTGVTSNFGCVVTGKQLFINGLYTRDLTDSEMSEMNEYKHNLTKFKEAKELINKERSKQAKQKLTAFALSRDESSSETGSTTTSSGKDNKTTNTPMPEPPKKPSFCTEESTTQYIFDGCKVQGKKVYVGNTYARDLNETEIQELKEFDKEMSKYETYLQSNLQKQLEKIFGNKLSSLFLSSKDIFDDDSNSVSDQTTTSVPKTDFEGEEVKMPTPPNFCTFIY